MEIFRCFRIEASHALGHLPAGHPCRTVHGHSWRIEVFLSGVVDEESGWVLDFGHIDAAFRPVQAELDHAHLNDVRGLERPTCENVARWIWRRLASALPHLSRVVVWEGGDAGCSYRGEVNGG